jgi:hypothetical protein
MAEISGAPHAQAREEEERWKEIVRSEVNYRDCEELDKGPGGLHFILFSHNPR